jgi:hypothetical protein
MDRLLLAGIAAESPLHRVVAATLAGHAEVRCGGPPRQVDPVWSRWIAPTDLNWSGTRNADASEPDTTIVVDFWGDQPPQQGDIRVWRLVDDQGQPLLKPFLWAHRWFRPPYYGAVFVTQETARGAVVLASAHLASRRQFEDFLSTIARACGYVLRAAVACRSLQDAVPFRPAPSRRPEPGGRVAAAMALARGGVVRRLERLRDRLLTETWAIGRLDLSIGDLIGRIGAPEPIILGELGLVQWTRAMAPDAYLADPFFYPGRSDRLLAEEFSYSTGLGRIVCLDGAGRRIEVLDLGFTCHLSYPFAWSDGADVLLLPESGMGRTTRLFRISGDRPPEVLCTVAEDIAMADATPFRHDGRYWIAYTDFDLGAHDNLCLLFADQITGPWFRHPKNPVKWDIRSSRPGGTPFRVGGSLYRPAQDCAAGYGAALAINRIDRCDPDGYREETVGIIKPDPNGPYRSGLHTLSFDPQGARALIDGKAYTLNPGVLVAKIRRRLSPGPAIEI